MTAKQYLMRVRRVEKEINSLLMTIAETRDKLTKITQTYDGDGVQSTKDPHKYDRLVELESLCDDLINKQLEIKAEILRAIEQLEDRRYRLVLKEYYVDCKTWEQVAVDLNFSYMHVMRLHGYALNKIKDVIECYTDSAV